MKSRTWIWMTAVHLFAALAVPPWTAAQEQPEGSNSGDAGTANPVPLINQANKNSNSVSILLGKGDGTFQAAVNYGAGTNPSPVALGDFNGDRKLDMTSVAQFNPASLDFVVIAGGGRRENLTTIMTNVGNYTLNITSITISGMYFSQTNNCGSSLGAQDSCNIVVTFLPYSAGTFTGAVSIKDNGGGSPQQVSLSGIAKCGGSCSQLMYCPGGCVCGSNHVCRPFGDPLNESFFKWNPLASVACGGD